MTRLTATRRQAGSKFVHELIRVHEDGNREVLDTRTSEHQYNYCIIKRSDRYGRSYSWSRNRGTGFQTTIPVQ